MNIRLIIVSRVRCLLFLTLLTQAVLADNNETDSASANTDDCRTWVQEETATLSKWESSKLRAHRQAKRRLPSDRLAEIAREHDAVVVKTRLRDVEITTGDTKAGYHRRFRAVGTFDVTLKDKGCEDG